MLRNNKKIDSNLRIFFPAIIFGLLIAPALGQTHTKPRFNPNLIPNAEINSPDNWELTGGAIYDSSESRTPGSGSILFDPTSGGLFSPYFPIEAGKRYTASIYMKTDGTPFVGISMYGALIPTETQSVNIGGSRYSNSKIGEWEECIFFFTPKEGQTHFKLKFTHYDATGQPRQGGKIWLDDAYVGLDESFENPPTPKIPFNGGMTRVDELGNISVKKGNSWEPFFPLCIYTDNGRTDHSFYSNQGFNCNMWASRASSLERSKAAGMMSGISVSQYVNKNGFAWNNMAIFENLLTGVVNSPAYDHMLFFYWDNEQSWGEEQWEANKKMVEIARRIDQGNHPIYVLQGSFGAARSYDNDTYKFQDLTGTYATVAGKTGHVVLDNLQNQKTPVTIAQFNNRGKELRADFWAHVARGARGMGYYRDRGESNPPVENTEWWDDFPKLRQEVDIMLPVLRQKHWADWTVRVDSQYADYGIREFQGDAYIIAANPTNAAIAPQFSLGGLSYSPHHARDALTNKVITDISGNSFQLLIEAFDARFIRLPRPETEFINPIAPTPLPSEHITPVFNIHHNRTVDIPCENDVKILTHSGELVLTLTCHSGGVIWKGKNDFNETVASGTYLIVEENKPLRKIVIIK